MKLTDIASVVRSKNAGPTTLTVDLMFMDEDGYRTALASPALSAVAIAELYGLSGNAVRVVPFPQARAIKLVMDRPLIAGSPGDRDVYGAQQHAQLLAVEL